MAGKHAILSASAAHRWLHCTPSARMTEEIEDSSSVYAAEGTAAHELAELLLRCDLNGNDGADVDTAHDFMKLNEYYDQSMHDYISEYVGFVIERYNEAKVKTKDALIFLEQKLDFSEWVPEGFGTGDVVIIADGIIEVIDLKYGKGVEVSADQNPQMMLYGLGAWSEYDYLYDLHTVRMTIVQPRIDNISTYEVSTEDLLKWAETTLKPAAQMAWNGEGDFVAGDHCKFCKARAICSARADFNLDFIGQFRDADEDLFEGERLDPLDVSRILGMSMEIKNWLKDIEEHALAKALEGIKYPGYKLVEGRSNRTINDEEAAVSVLAERFSEEEIYNKKLKGITDLEKLLGKKNFESYLGPYIIKPPGKPTLVLETDKRPEINTAADDFNLEI